MIDLVRSEYGYTDEYILDKTFLWLGESVKCITRRRYDNAWQNGLLIASHVAVVFGGKDSKPVPRYEELYESSTKLPGNHNEEAPMQDSLSFLSKKPKSK